MRENNLFSYLALCFFGLYNNADLYDMSPKLTAISYCTLLKLNVFLLLYEMFIFGSSIFNDSLAILSASSLPWLEYPRVLNKIIITYFNR